MKWCEMMWNAWTSFHILPLNYIPITPIPFAKWPEPPCAAWSELSWACKCWVLDVVTNGNRMDSDMVGPWVGGHESGKWCSIHIAPGNGEWWNIHRLQIMYITWEMSPLPLKTSEEGHLITLKKNNKNTRNISGNKHHLLDKVCL